jgi:hypothetical protein
MNAIRVKELRGRYRIEIGAWPTPLQRLLKGNGTLRVVATLLGWGRWKTVVHIEGRGLYFTDMSSNELREEILNGTTC